VTGVQTCALPISLQANLTVTRILFSEHEVIGQTLAPGQLEVPKSLPSQTQDVVVLPQKAKS
jgi:hypothetical protein